MVTSGQQSPPPNRDRFNQRSLNQGISLAGLTPETAEAALLAGGNFRYDGTPPTPGPTPLTASQGGAVRAQLITTPATAVSPWGRPPLVWPTNGTTLWLSRLGPLGDVTTPRPNTDWVEVRQLADGPHGPGGSLALQYVVGNTRTPEGDRPNHLVNEKSGTNADHIYDMVATTAAEGQGLRPGNIRGVV